MFAFFSHTRTKAQHLTNCVKKYMSHDDVTTIKHPPKISSTQHEGMEMENGNGKEIKNMSVNIADLRFSIFMIQICNVATTQRQNESP